MRIDLKVISKFETITDVRNYVKIQTDLGFPKRFSRNQLWGGGAEGP